LRRGRNVLVHCQQVSFDSTLAIHLRPTTFIVASRL
jgi:hypothetical protein